MFIQWAHFLHTYTYDDVYVCIQASNCILITTRQKYIERSRIDNMPLLIIAALFNAFVRPFNAISEAYARSRSVQPSVGFRSTHTHVRTTLLRDGVCGPGVQALQAVSGSRRIVGFPRSCLHCPVVLLRDAHSRHPPPPPPRSVSRPRGSDTQGGGISY